MVASGIGAIGVACLYIFWGGEGILGALFSLYAIFSAGIVGIFSDVKPYDRLGDQFDWPWLCSNTAEDWYNAAKKLLDNPEQLELFRQKAMQLASGTFSIPVIAETLDAELDALPVQPRQDCEKVGTLPLLKLMALWARFVSGVKRYGFKTPAMILRRLKITLTR